MTKKGRELAGDGGHDREQRLKGPVSHKMKNMQRLGGKGLSLAAFANSKSGATNYNPAYIKKQREFYKNAKFVSKYKKSIKQKEPLNNGSVSTGFVPTQTFEGKNVENANYEKKRHKKKHHMSTKELYEKTVEAKQKETTERKAIRQAKEEEKKRSEVERKALKVKMLKKTNAGQPVMKYRIEHLLESIQSSTR